MRDRRPTTGAEVIPAVEAGHPEFRFIAEAYWDLEWALQQQGFDYCYDKRLYDRLEHAEAEVVRLHLCADRAYQERLVRFIENHDEPRAAASFPPAKARAAAVTALTQAGARLVHEGQLEGRKVRLPVFLARRPDEPADAALGEFYRRLLGAASDGAFRDGHWQLCERSGWPDNASFLNLVAWCWRHDERRYLIVVNLSGAPSQATVRVPWDEVRGRNWRLERCVERPVVPAQRRRPGRPGDVRRARPVGLPLLPVRTTLQGGGWLTHVNPPSAARSMFVERPRQRGNRMAKAKKKGKASAANEAPKEKLKSKVYDKELERLHVELVKLQEWVKHKGLKVCVVFEGRDGAGKGGTIKAITERVSPRVFRVVALPAPTEREKSQMYAQRYLPHLPAAGEVVIFDRSWYNRAGVERVMGFCTEEVARKFLTMVPHVREVDGRVRASSSSSTGSK